MGWFLIEEAVDAVSVGWAGGVVVGRAAAGRGAGAAAGFAGAGRAAARPGAVCADRFLLAGSGALSRSSDDLDGELCAFDGRQGADGLGVRDAGAGGFRLAAFEALLPDRAWGACAARVDGAQAHGASRRGRGGRADALRDRQGAARDALQGESREDRLDGGGGRRSLSQRRGLEPGRCEDAGPPGAQADRACRWGRWKGARPKLGARTSPAGDLSHTGPPHRRAQKRRS